MLEMMAQGFALGGGPPLPSVGELYVGIGAAVLIVSVVIWYGLKLVCWMVGAKW